jgi:hypothetical protein
MALTQAAIADMVSPRERGRYQVHIDVTAVSVMMRGTLATGVRD